MSKIGAGCGSVVGAGVDWEPVVNIGSRSEPVTGTDVVSVTGGHLDQQQHRQPTGSHREDKGAQRGDPAPAGGQYQ